MRTRFSGRRIPLALTMSVFLGMIPAVAQADGAPDAAQPAANAAFFDSDPLADSALAAISGREALPAWLSANSTNTATVGNNQVGDNSATGSLTVADNAFQNISGVSMVNLNTGNNSAINASINLNVLINPVLPSGAGGM